MVEIATIGIDLAKNVFQVHGVNASGVMVVRKAMRRAQVLSFFKALPRCLVGMEACATSHYWAREIAAAGHEVRLMPPQYVKAYVKRKKALYGRVRGRVLDADDSTYRPTCAHFRTAVVKQRDIVDDPVTELTAG